MSMTDVAEIARGLCVTVTPTTYAFTGGTCEGVIVGLINYGRFPTHNYMEIWEQAYSLAMFLKERLGQGSFTLQDNYRSYFYSTRPEDVGDLL